MAILPKGHSIIGYENGNPLLNRIATDQKTVAERKWRAGLKPDKPQAACDVGLFSDDSKQTELKL